MTTYRVENFGCRATQADAAAIEQQLIVAGFAPCAKDSAADVIVFNTCTVTAAADLQARQAIAAESKRAPKAKIIVTGCYAQRDPEQIAALPGVTWVVGNSHQREIAKLAAGRKTQSSIEVNVNEPLIQISKSKISKLEEAADNGVRDSLDFRAKILSGDSEELGANNDTFGGISLGGHTRPILKIQDGCDNRCSYCVIPFVRGKSRSMEPKAVVREIRRLSESGTQEVVLSGINLGSYGRDLGPRIDLLELLRRIIKETPIARLRLSSIEPMDVTHELAGFVASSERIARHFHMPLQSGSDRILAGMRRWYRSEHYAEHARLIRRVLPDAAIGADVIAGFPGETEKDHQTTLEFIESEPLDYLHVFSFSERPGTTAAALAQHVSERDVQRRAKELRNLGGKKQAAFRGAQTRRILRVLTLEPKPADRERNLTRAISSNYLDLRVRGSWPANRWLDVRVVRTGTGSIEAEQVFPVAAD